MKTCQERKEVKKTETTMSKKKQAPPDAQRRMPTRSKGNLS